MTTATTCRTCGTEPLENAQFCHSCGSPISAETRPAEYKQVTVLFADVVHSMDIASAVGAERLREIMSELFNCCSGMVHRYGGTVDKFTGDGIMALFGAPVALEDHAFRACLAALDIQDQALELAAEVQRQDRIDFQLRVGLNSGQVIAGEIDSNPTSYTAIGEQVGMAQRMESAAPPGGVMLSESTARLVEDVATLGEPELVHIKGAAEAVRARRLLAASPDRRHTGRQDPSLVGRAWEMGALTGMLDAAIDGTGCVVGLVGPPGIGKSRIAREITTLAQRRDVEVFAAYCESHASEIPFYTVTSLLRTALGTVGLGDEAVRAPANVRRMPIQGIS
jgi:adenylate cyclase